MSALQIVLVALAGVWAGFINSVVGSGSLITFPTLIALGVPPIPANVSNNIGLLGGGYTSILGYRRELSGQRRTLARLLPASAVGSLVGSLLLLKLPAAVFSAVVPVLVVAALVLVVLQPRIARRMAARQDAAGARPRWAAPALVSGVTGAGVYGGYFGAAQGVVLLGLLGSLLDADLQRVNAVKNVLGTVVNTVAAVVFLVVALDQVRWPIVGLILVGSMTGGWLGSRVGRRLSPTVLRAVIVVVGSLALVRLLGSTFGWWA